MVIRKTARRSLRLCESKEVSTRTKIRITNNIKTIKSIADDLDDLLNSRILYSGERKFSQEIDVNDFDMAADTIQSCVKDLNNLRKYLVEKYLD